MKTIEATYKLSAERYKQINRISYYKSRLLWAMVIIFVIATALFAYNIYNSYIRAHCQFSPWFFEKIWPDIALIIFYLLLIWHFLFGRNRGLNKRLKSSPLINAVYNYKFTSKKMSSKTLKDGRVISETTMDWNLVSLAYIYKDIILLRMAMGFYFIPADAFKTRAEFTEFKTFIKSTIKKVVNRSK